MLFGSVKRSIEIYIFIASICCTLAAATNRNENEIDDNSCISNATHSHIPFSRYFNVTTVESTHM